MVTYILPRVRVGSKEGRFIKISCLISSVFIFEVGAKIYTPSYISLETVLQKEGVIF